MLQLEPTTPSPAEAEPGQGSKASKMEMGSLLDQQLSNTVPSAQEE